MADPKELDQIADALAAYKDAGSPSDLKPKVKAFVQGHYDSLQAQGFWSKPENASIGHSLRSIGMAVDPSQGGATKLVQTGVDEHNQPTYKRVTTIPPAQTPAQKALGAQRAQVAIDLMRAEAGQPADNMPVDEQPGAGMHAVHVSDFRDDPDGLALKQDLKRSQDAAEWARRKFEDISRSQRQSSHQVVDYYADKVVTLPETQMSKDSTKIWGNVGAGAVNLITALPNAADIAFHGAKNATDQAIDEDNAKQARAAADQEKDPDKRRFLMDKANSYYSHSNNLDKQNKLLGTAVVTGVKQTPIIAPSVRAIGYLSHGDRQGFKDQSKLVGRDILADPVGAGAMVIGGVGFTASMVEHLAGGMEIGIKQVLAASAKALKAGDKEAAEALVNTAKKMTATVTKLRTHATKLHMVANPLGDHTKNSALSTAKNADLEADTLHAGANVSALRDPLFTAPKPAAPTPDALENTASILLTRSERAHKLGDVAKSDDLYQQAQDLKAKATNLRDRGVTNPTPIATNEPTAADKYAQAAALQEQAAMLRASAGKNTPVKGFLPPDQAQPVTAGINGAAPVPVGNSTPGTMKMVAKAPLGAPREVLPGTGGKFVAGGKIIEPGLLNNGEAKPPVILPTVRAKTPATVPAAQEPVIVTAKPVESAVETPALKVTTAETAPAAEPVVTPKPSNKSKPDMAGPINLGRSGLSDVDKEAVKADVKAKGFDSLPVKTHESTRAASEALGLSPDMLRDITPGQVPNGVHPADFALSVDNLSAYLRKKVRDTQAIYDTDPSPANKATLDQLKLDAASALEHSVHLSRTQGQALNARNIDRVPSMTAVVRAKLQNTPSLSDIHEPVMKVTTKAPRAPRVTKTYGANNKIVNADKYAQSLENLKGYYKAATTRANSGIDPAFLPDLIKVGVFHLEAGARKFGDWTVAFKGSLGDASKYLTDGDLQTVYAHSQTDLRKGIESKLRDTSQDVFVDHLASKYGSRANASKFVDSVDPETLDALIHNKSMTAAQHAEVVAADAAMIKKKPGTGKASSGAIKTVNDILESHRKMTAAGHATPPTEVENLHKYFGKQITEKGADDLRKAIGEQAFKNIAEGKATNEELAAAAAKYESIRKSLTPKEGTPSYKPQGFGEALKAHRAAQPRTPKPGTGSGNRSGSGTGTGNTGGRQNTGAPKAKAAPTNEQIFRKAVIQRIGAKKFDDFMSALDSTPEGKAAHAKITSGQALNDTEKLRIARNIDALQTKRVAGIPHDIVKQMREIVADARSGRLSYDDPRDMVSDAFKTTLGKDDPKGFAELTDKINAVDKNPDGSVSDKGRYQLAELVNRYSKQTLADNLSSYLKSSLLSGPATLSKIALSHIMAVATEDILNRPLAAAISQGTVEGLNVKSSIGAINKGFVQGGKDALSILKHGDNQLALKGHNQLTQPGKPFRPEFTSKNAALNAVVRFPMRVHSALYHMIGSSIYDRALREAASLGARKLGGSVAADAKRLYENPTNEMMDHARAQYEQQMFVNSNIANDALGKFKQHPMTNAAVDVIAPFTKVPSNIAGRAAEYTPIGSVISALHQGILGTGERTAAQQANISRTLSRGVTGTTLIALGYELAREHRMNAPDRDKFENGSININGRKVDVNGLAPIINPVLLGASILDEQKRREEGLPNHWKDVAEEYLTDSPLMGIGQTMTDLKEPKGNTLNRIAGSTMGMAVPTLLSQAAAELDPTHATRKKMAPMDYVKNRIPGLRESLPLSQDLNGKPIPEGGGIISGLRNVPTKTPTQTERLSQAIKDTQEHMAAMPIKTQRDLDNKRIEGMVIKTALKMLGGYFSDMSQRKIGNNVQPRADLNAKDVEMALRALEDARAGKLNTMKY
jgi:hypothetical protein